METLIYIIIAICIVLAIALIAILGVTWVKENKEKKGKSSNSGSSDGKTKSGSSESVTRLQGIESMSKFLDFDAVVDNMIVRKNRTQYVMVLHCKGINFDLLGEQEKIAVESGFVQFLNTLRFPIQLYVQSRSINLNESISKYEKRVNNVRDELAKIEMQIKREQTAGNTETVKKLEFEKKKKMNILEYGADITNYVARLSQNRNVLQQNTYLAISYHTMEIGTQLSNYSKEEIDGLAFSELYTRAQTLIRALSSAGVSAKVMDSEELAELLYVAYNRDDSELISIRKSIDAEYDSLYNTAKDLLEKQKEAIEEKAERDAIELTSNSLEKASKIIKLREANKAEIRRRALAYVEQYKGEMTKDLYEETIEQINKSSQEDDAPIKK
ncbi:MAG: hypothetical protein IKD76_04440 [Clostridia bacterium]|nr:hypothetical protein [Clostridia bacterium]